MSQDHPERSPKPNNARSSAAEILGRSALFVLFGMLGWVIGSLLGAFVGAGLDLLLLSDQPTGPGTVGSSYVLQAGAIGGVIGVLAFVIWVGRHLRPRA